MPSYIYQAELPHGLPTTSQVQRFHTLPDAPANELERMVQELSHGLPATDTETVMEEETTDPVLIDDDPGQAQYPLLDLSGLEEVIQFILSAYDITFKELRYELVETHVDGQACFIPVAKVIVREPRVHGVWGVVGDSIRRCLDLWGLEEFDVEIDTLLANVQEGDSEPWN
ncbi:uncharacterized protein P174DRAFT_515352 [Aspergillus novofumigatus IBT 16806]|uniref:Uncharacterized protein n=1 Tax=Aspergillus novofumigatus (strain IBT 16806) TaxID=1392255 RepID=A0A2I1BXW8_ASPN1|nr:uncharacterized protein P174DRAFT_515352 [Aspergillus novofumigatus IBT 16806]PKX90210.1 hypothetical protein P174DRAFT_515352 [Aspergillus novofumigatus IBT 16806]